MKDDKKGRSLAAVLEKEELQTLWSILEDVIFPLLLLLFPLLKMNQGIDLTDTGYSLGNYRFFGQVSGVWTLLTFLSNVLGFFFTKLPMGGTMLGVKLYCSLLISVAALLGYRFFKTKMPSSIAFLGEMAAIGFCWCPAVILYNYLTYLLFLLGAILLFRGLAGCRPACLVAAGMVLGVNGMVRFPNNILESALILAVWYYGALKKKSLKRIARETGLCVVGFLAAFLVLVGVICGVYGGNAFGTMVNGVFGMAKGASDYTLGEMVLAILDAYFHGFRWMLYMILCILPGIPFLVIRKEYLAGVRKVVYCICIPVLFFVLGKWGMFNFKYYQKEAALQWGVVFLLVAIGVTIWMLYTKMLDDEWRLIGCIALIVILITPLGSNNHIWPVLNNLFFIVPVVFWMGYRFARWGRIYLDTTGKVPLFPVKAMISGILAAFFVQAIGIGSFYVFLDGETGQERNYKVAGNSVLKGMYTNEMNAETLEEISAFMTENRSEYEGKKLILYGNIPGLAYYLDMAPAIYTTWADLNTSSLSQLQEELTEMSYLNEAVGEDRPLVILTPKLSAYLAGNQEAMAFWGTDVEACDGDEKLKAIWNFMEGNHYVETFSNEAFTVYE
ncbi:hypothetical protein [Parablautia muri]|uniref:Uncharacterized protein n=1 Tax=Parablautia muri TaxID=2320879 RepID=A0A9X5GQN5_9FIRM|nr:hypothetical protein [Parablautia muri]NBJ91271.1 hypothetical protein [Parablautia muri]